MANIAEDSADTAQAALAQPPVPRPNSWQLLWAWWRNILAFVGLLTVLAALVFYYQGHKALQQFDPHLRQAALDFLKQAMNADVASALAVRIPLEPGISFEDAAKSMELRASHLGLPLVGHYKIHAAVAGHIGTPTRHTEIMEFCNADIAYEILRHNPDYLAHMPCRIGLYEDDSGKGWLVTANLNLLIHGSKGMFPELKAQALAVQDALLEIMAAGAGGDLSDPR